MRKQWIFAIDKIRKEVLERAGTPIVRHQPDPYARPIFCCVPHEAFFRNVLGQRQSNSVKPASNR